VEGRSGIKANLAARTAVLGVVGGVDKATSRGLTSANSVWSSASKSLANTDVALVSGNVGDEQCRALIVATVAVVGIIGSLNLATVGN